MPAPRLDHGFAVSGTDIRLSGHSTFRLGARSLVRRALATTVFREGAVRTILAGPSRGLRYRIFPEFGLSPIYGGWEPDLQRLMAENVGPDSVAYDLGANYGMHTLLLARLTAGSGHVYAFEPSPIISRELVRNVTLNGFTGVTVLQAAVSSTTSSREFVQGSHCATGRLAEEGDRSAETLTVDAVSLDDFAFRLGNRAPHFIKIDVEGAEGEVLSGAMRVLRETRPVMLVELHSPTQDIAVGRCLLASNYRAYRVCKRGATSRIRDLTKGWPEPDGLWGKVIAFPATSG